MVGGSATPVVAIAVPAVFGLVVTAVGMMHTAPSRELVEAIKALGEKSDTVPEIVDFRARQRHAPARIGLALMAFSLAYLGGATLGASVRINHYLVTTTPASAFPWTSTDLKPPTLDLALQWIALQSRLHELGYDENKIRELYAIQITEWKNNPTRAARGAGVPNAGQPIGETKPPPQPPAASLLPAFPFSFPVSPIPGSPFAHQPREQLRDNLKDVVPPGMQNRGEVKG